MAKSCTGAAQVVRCDRCQTTAFGVCLHNCPDHLRRKTVSRDSACLIDGPQQWTRIYTGSKTPIVDRLLHPCRNGMVRIWPPFPLKSAITQRPSRSWKSSNRKVVTSPLRRPQPITAGSKSSVNGPLKGPITRATPYGSR
jgi:hypothetical protein